MALVQFSKSRRSPPPSAKYQIGRISDRRPCLIGEGKPYLSVLANLNREQWTKLAAEKGYAADEAALRDPAVEKVLLARIAAQMKHFPGYAQVRRIRAALRH